eukprot:2805637-Prymnesium_polylepis.3
MAGDGWGWLGAAGDGWGRLGTAGDTGDGWERRGTAGDMPVECAKPLYSALKCRFHPARLGSSNIRSEMRTNVQMCQ